jgi:hypothetical protein
MNIPEKNTVSEFLSNEVYLPGYMVLRKEDYDKNGGTFLFDVKEPLVTRGDLVHYFTPRGLHMCISQAGYALVENMVNEGMLEGYEIDSLRKMMLESRVKITEIYQKFKREIELDKPIQGRFDISKLRLGKMPILRLNFGFENSAVFGYFTSLIAPKPMPQLNQDLLRF